MEISNCVWAKKAG